MNQVNNDNVASSRVVFYKTQPVPLTAENVKTIVNVVTMSGPPEEAFLKSVQNVTITEFRTNYEVYRYSAAILQQTIIKINSWLQL